MSFTRVSIFAILTIGLILPCGLAPSPRTADALDESVDQAAIEILEKTWDKKQESKKLADGIIGELVRTGQADIDVTYAYLLAKVRQSDVRKAVSAAEHLLKLDPNHLRANHAYCWLLLLTRKQASALAALPKFDKANDEDKTIDEETRLANIRSIGRMYGYLEGPQAEEVSETSMKAVLKTILDGATDAETKAFDEQRQIVLQKFREIVTEKQDTEAETVAEGKKEQQETLAEIKKTEEKLDKREQELEPQRDKVSAEGQEAISRIESRAQPVVAALEELNQEALALENDRSSYIRDAIYYENLAAREPEDSLNIGRYLRQADRARSAARSIEFSLNNVYRRMQSAGASLQLLQRELVATQKKYGAKISSIDSEMSNIEKQLKRAKGQANRASKPVRENSGRSKALDNKAKGITTYEDFPIELERERLLAMLKARAGK